MYEHRRIDGDEDQNESKAVFQEGEMHAIFGFVVRYVSRRTLILNAS